MKAKRFFSFHWLFGFILIVICLNTTWAVQSYKPQIADPLLEPWRWHFFPEISGRGIRCMLEAKDKSMWFGTEKGVLHYDGLNWATYTLGDSLFKESVLGLFESKDGKIYAGTRQGISRFENGHWVKIFSDSTSNITYSTWRTSSIIEASDGSIWTGMVNGALHIKDSGLIYYTTKEFSDLVKKLNPNVEISLLPEKIVEGIEFFAIYSVFEDKEGNIWFGFFGGEICQYKYPNKWRLVHKTDEKPQVNQTRDGTIWVISDGSNIQYSGPCFYNSAADTQWYHIDLKSIGGKHSNCSFLQTRDGAIWIGGIRNYHVFKNGKWHIYKASDIPVPISSRIFLFESSDGLLWIYGHKNDVYRVEYTDSRWSTYLGLNFQFETEDGSKWFISGDNGVVCQRHGTWIRYGTEDGLIDAPSALLYTRKGQIWAAGSHKHNAATALFDGKRWHRKIHSKISWGIDYRAAFEALDGTLYFGSTIDRIYDRGDVGGLLKYDPFEKDVAKTWTHMKPDMVLHTAVYGIGQTADSTIWIGRNSLLKFDGEISTGISDPKVLSNSYINCIENSENGHLWVGSRSYGVFYYNCELWKNYTINSGLTSNTIISILPTSDTTAWVATDNDICYFDGQIWTTYMFPELMTLTIQGGTLKMSRDGVLWINRSSRSWFRRSRPGSRLTREILSNYWTVAYRPDRSAPETEITVYEEKVSQPGNALIAWRGIDPWKVTSDEKLQYSYRLDNGAWSPFTYEKSRIFLSLSSGKHTFEVKARDMDFNTDSTPACVQFSVLPSVWRHPLVIIMAAVFLLVASYLEVNVLRRDKKLHNVNEELTETNTALSDANMTIKASLEEKEVLLKEIHHRVKNNLQVISSLLNLQSLHIKNKRALEMFKDSQDRVRSMALVHEKLYQFKDLAKVDFADYIKSLANSLYHSYEVSPERVELDVKVRDVSLSIDTAVSCGLIINELVSNALKHTFPPTWKRNRKIGISLLRTEENEFELIVYDNGVGLPENIDLRNTDSFGLYLVTLLVSDQLQGEITLDRKGGTRYQIRFRE